MGRIKSVPNKKDFSLGQCSLSTIGELRPFIRKMRKTKKTPKEPGRTYSLNFAQEAHRNFYLGDIKIGRTSNVLPGKIEVGRIEFNVQNEEQQSVILILGDEHIVVYPEFDIFLLRDLVQDKQFLLEIYTQGEALYFKIFLIAIPLPRPHRTTANSIKNIFKILYNMDFADLAKTKPQSQNALTTNELNQVYAKLMENKDWKQHTFTGKDLALLKPSLRPYQEQSLQWMIHRENEGGTLKDDINPAYEKVTLRSGRVVFVEKFTALLENEPPVVSRGWKGGILADEMGLGKTIEVLALILSHQKTPSPTCTVSDTVKCVTCDKLQHISCLAWRPELGPYKCPQCWEAADLIESKATLIVVPATLSRQWCREMETHLKYGLKVLHYEGCTNSPVYPAELLDYDIVITTYSVLKSDIKLTETNTSISRRQQRKYWPILSPIVRVLWWRICLDEAQTVELPMISKITKKISACHKWAVTGTPMSKGIADIFALIDYLQMEPYNDLYTWNNVLYYPYVAGNTQPMYDFLSKILWRTSKSAVLNQINIPEQSEKLHMLEFSAVEKFFYNREHELMQPLVSLRQACSDASTVRGKGRYLSLKRDAYSMKDLLEALILKNKCDCEEALRLLVSSNNGLAGTYLLMNDPEQAIAEYRKVLQLAAKFSLVERDGCGKIDVETHQPKMRTIRDSSLRKDCTELEKQYIEKTMKEASLLALLKSKNCEADIIKDGETHLLLLEALKKEFKEISKLWTLLARQVCAQDEVEICKVRLQFKEKSQNKTVVDKQLKMLSYEQNNIHEHINLISPEEVCYQELTLRSDESQYNTRLEALLGRRNYLNTLRQQQFEGYAPDPCPICQSPLVKTWAILSCAHTYCLECSEALINKTRKQDLQCSVCRSKQSIQDLAYINSCSDGAAQDEDETKISVLGNYCKKIESVVQLVLSLRRTTPTVQVLIFSSWTVVLKLLGKALEQNHVTLELDPLNNITALLIPIEFGSKGLNLIEATHVILMEPLLDTANELQAIGRVHRIGQTNDVSVENCRETLLKALKMGVNYIDTAPYYGHGESEEVLGKILEGIPRKAYYIATKVGRYEKDLKEQFNFSAEKTKQSIEASLQRLRLDYVDVLQVHDVEFAPSLDMVLNETLPTVQEIVKSGKARFMGVTGYPVRTLAECVQKSPVKLDMILSYARLTLFDETLKEFLPVFKMHLNAFTAFLLQQNDVELGKLAVWHSLQQEGPATTLVGMDSVEIVDYNLEVLHNGLTFKERELYQQVLGCQMENPTPSAIKLSHVNEPSERNVTKTTKDSVTMEIKSGRRMSFRCPRQKSIGIEEKRATTKDMCVTLHASKTGSSPLAKLPYEQVERAFWMNVSQYPNTTMRDLPFLARLMAERYVDLGVTTWDKLSDPRTSSWPFIQSPVPTILMVLTYLYVILWLGPRLMANRKPFKLKEVLFVYNGAQVLLSLYMFYEHFASGWFLDYSYKCQPVDYSTNDRAMRMARLCWIYYVSKLTEFADTVFFVMRKKDSQITFLHVYHHSLTPLETWFLVKFIAGGHGTLQNLINNFVHAILYFYYMVAALGPEYQKYLWWKKHLTTLQLRAGVGTEQRNVVQVGEMKRKTNDGRTSTELYLHISLPSTQVSGGELTSTSTKPAFWSELYVGGTFAHTPQPFDWSGPFNDSLKFPALVGEGSPAGKRTVPLDLVPHLHPEFRQVEEDTGNVVAAVYGEVQPAHERQGVAVHMETPTLGVHLDSVVNGKGELQQLYCPGTVDHSHQITFQLDEGNPSMNDPYIPLNYTLVDKEFFTKSSMEEIEVILESLNHCFESKWPYFEDELEHIEWVMGFSQPFTHVQVRLEDNFHLGIFTGGTWFFSGPLQLAKSDWSQSFYMPKITGTIPLEGTIRTCIKCDLDLCIISLTSSVRNNIRLLRFASTHVLSNYLSTQVQVMCFAVPDAQKVWDFPKLAESHCFSIAPHSGKRWHCRIAPFSSVHYSTPTLSGKFPELPQVSFAQKVSLAYVSTEGRNIEWSAGVSIVNNNDLFIRVPHYGDVKLTIINTACTTILTLESVSQVEISARDIRVRLSLRETEKTTSLYKDFTPLSADDHRNVMAGSSGSSVSNSEMVPISQWNLDISKRKTEDSSARLLAVSSKVKDLLVKTLPLKEGWESIEATVYVKSFGITLLTDTEEDSDERWELASLICDDVVVTAKQTEQLTVQISLSDIQLDNQLYARQSFDFPVVLIGQERRARNRLNILSTPIETLLASCPESALIITDLVLDTWANKAAGKTHTDLDTR
ncbi:hypothetical protein HUJ04_006175 [Dendroctonus ponderosae]|nr:hypothetical protein HUJ04_006175 [Dendroctonus ponderosae]